MTHQAWQIGIATGCCANAAIVDVLPVLERAGCPGVEISTPPRHFDTTSADQAGALAAYLQASPIEAVSMHAPFGADYELAALDPVRRGAAVAAAVHAAELLATLGGGLLVVHTSDLERHGRPVADHLACGRESLHALAARCRELGITVAVESPLPHLIGGHPSEFSDLLSRLDDDVAVCLDTGHVSLGHHWRDFVAVAGHRLRHVHVSDNHGYFDDHLPPGDGILDWVTIRRSLSEARFEGWLILELTTPHRPELPFLIRSLEQAHRLFGRVLP